MRVNAHIRLVALLLAGCGFTPVENGAHDAGPLVCTGEHYDIDGRTDDGCELEDLPLQDTPDSAVPVVLPDVDDPALGNPRNLAGQILGDARPHEAPLVDRPNGRPDWYRVTADGAGDPNQKMGACLSILDFPADNTYEVCITEANSTVFGTNQCQLVAGGGSSVCVRPASQPDSGGPFYVRVRKLNGSNVHLSYALFLSH